jgi:hypothetical protein
MKPEALTITTSKTARTKHFLSAEGWDFTFKNIARLAPCIMGTDPAKELLLRKRQYNTQLGRSTGRVGIA